LHAVGREETWDLGLRVWSDPPGGLDSVIETFQATLPGVAPTPEITPETWIFDTEAVRAVGFVDRERKIAVLLTCGGMQCIDVETAIVLARHVHDRLDQLATMEATEAVGPTTTPVMPEGTPPETPATTPPETPATTPPETPATTPTKTPPTTPPGKPATTPPETPATPPTKPGGAK
jgi:hypothetical protein